ncbi:MAG TPA: bifunctional 2-polyprenyl-6-hydroxyphenol methylase/3-demethylubiquinol 3-O-methyltransferase UbiG [Casimicrobiaceae bacterium]|nr:bifunctional 2-polyprenyl-6-hydroxyphenol methylase/3-demethylubiquinol 3-O-methyltransferase UbiG [Casimicrobiaceae bacterium]
MTPVAVPINADAAELARFSEFAYRWWDPTSELFGPLHAMNPIRLDWIDRVAKGLAGKTVLDVGCGGGILSEAMAQRGAKVLGIDLAERALGVAKLHRLESGVGVDYRLVSVEALAEEMPAAFDLVTCLEMLEHVPDPAAIVHATGKLLKPGGIAIFSTINRNAKSYAYAILGAEYVLRLLPRGTHDYARFLRPAEVARFGRAGGLVPIELAGISYHPLTRAFRLASDTSVNYLMALRRTDDA